jgi:hypothetical protein
MNSMVMFDEHGSFELVESSLLDVVAAGGWSLGVSVTRQRVTNNQNCPSQSYNNDTCVAPVNGGCGYSTNEVCVFIPT